MKLKNMIKFYVPTWSIFAGPVTYGLANEKIQQRLLSEARLSLKKAFEIAQSMETTQRETQVMRASGSHTEADIRHMNAISRKPVLAVVKEVTTLINVSLERRACGKRVT